LSIEFQPAQTNRVERVKRFANVYLHCIINNLKRISKLSTLVLQRPGNCAPLVMPLSMVPFPTLMLMI